MIYFYYNAWAVLRLGVDCGVGCLSIPSGPDRRHPHHESAGTWRVWMRDRGFRAPRSIYKHTQAVQWGYIARRAWGSAKNSRISARQPLSLSPLLEHFGIHHDDEGYRSGNTGLGSSSLIAHVLHSPPPPTRTALY